MHEIAPCLVQGKLSSAENQVADLTKQLEELRMENLAKVCFHGSSIRAFTAVAGWRRAASWSRLQIDLSDTSSLMPLRMHC